MASPTSSPNPNPNPNPYPNLQEPGHLLQVVSTSTLGIIVAPAFIHSITEIWLRFYAMGAGLVALIMIAWYTEDVLQLLTTSDGRDAWTLLTHQVTVLTLIGVNIFGLFAGFSLLCREKAHHKSF